MSGGPSATTEIAELEAHGVLLVIDEALTVTNVSEGCASLLGDSPSQLVGQPLRTAVCLEAEGIASDVLTEGLDRAGGWWFFELLDGTKVKMRAFEAARGRIGLDLLPLVGGAIPRPDPDSIERVAAWNDWLLACSTSADLLEVGASVTRERLGFDGVWVCRIEPEGHNTVVAADDPGGADLIGQSIVATDIPPSQPLVRERWVPFFVADVASPGTRLVPQDASLDLDGSALLRPYPEFLERLKTLGVRATASLPLVVGGQLWGRIIAHDPTAKRVPAPTQSELRLLAAATSARLTELIEQEDAREQVGLARYSLRLMSAVAASTDLVDGLVSHPEDLVGICAADGAIVAIGERVATTGLSIDPAQLDALLEVVRSSLTLTTNTPVVAAASTRDVPDLDSTEVAGFLGARIGSGPEDILVWTRREDTRAVTWIEHEVVGDVTADELFTGVAQRREATSGACAPWTAAQIAQADELRDAVALVQLARYGKMQALNAELTRSNEEYDAFAHAAAHDLKAPIRGIRQFVEFHLEDTQDRLSEEEQQQLFTVTRLTERMDGLLDGLMAYAQIGKAAWESNPVRVEDAVADVIEWLGPKGAGATIRATTDTFTTDAGALGQILLNLIGNAIKYSDGPAVVDVAVSSLHEAAKRGPLPPAVSAFPGDTQVLTVSDQGIGIDPDHHERIFGLFHQLEPSAEGTGTGLALCRLTCRRHGGEIWLNSTRGHGCTFFVVTGT